MTANAIPVDSGNRLLMRFWNADADSGYFADVRYQILNKDGTISQNYQRITVANEANGTSFLLSLAPGWLLAVTVTAPLTSLQNGILYCVGSIQYGSVNTPDQQLPIMSGYVVAEAPLNYPLSDLVAVNSGLPATVEGSIADPGPQTEIGKQLSATGRHQLRTFLFTLVTSATVLTRQVALSFTTANGEYIRVNAAATQTAAQTKIYQLWLGTTPPAAPTGYIYIPCPELPPLQTLIISTVTTNFDADDEYSGIRYVEQVHAAIS